MTAVEHDAAAVEGPGCAVIGIRGCVDACAGILPLGCGGGEGVAAPGGLIKAEMCGCEAGEGEEGEDGGAEHFGGGYGM